MLFQKSVLPSLIPTKIPEKLIVILFFVMFVISSTCCYESESNRPVGGTWGLFHPAGHWFQWKLSLVRTRGQTAAASGFMQKTKNEDEDDLVQIPLNPLISHSDLLDFFVLLSLLLLLL